MRVLIAVLTGLLRSAGDRRAVLAATAVAVANAVAFLAVRPGVGDLWAARAWRYAAAHGVGLTYWFSWFGGGAPPGGYSVLTPYLSAAVGAALLAALATVALTPLSALALRATRHPVAGTWIATLAYGVNLWSGRVPFAVGSALAVAALHAVSSRRRAPAAVLAVLATLTSPVCGAFLLLGLAGVAGATRSHRSISATTALATAVGLLAIAVAFGAPGPEGYDLLQATVAVGGLLPLLAARPPKPVTVIILLALAACPLLVAIPNGLGSNFGRLVWICLPAAVVATSRRRAAAAVLAAAVALYSGVQITLNDLQIARQPVAAAGYYTPLAAELDTLPALDNYRLEVVDDGAHTAAYTLLGHALLARGYETQADNALNPILNTDLTPASYRNWLDDNAVGYVALSRDTLTDTPERRLVSTGHLPYLTPIWHTADWTLLQVRDPTPVVSPPASVVDADPANLVITVPRSATVTVRVRWSRYLTAPGPDDNQPARLAADPAGWTTLTVTVAGRYTLRGQPA